MPNVTIAEILVLAYLSGSIPFGFLLVRFFLKRDVRSIGSGNIGATNVMRSGNKGLGALTFLLDAMKGVAAVLIAHQLGKGVAPFHGAQGLSLTDTVALAGLVAMLGHIYPVWLGFKGGKGVATAFGVFLAMDPKAALAALAIFVIVFAIWRYVSLASITSVAAFPFLVLTLAPHQLPVLYLIVTFLVSFIIIVKHHANIKRLMSGTELRMGSTKQESK
jgi:glycerol-3-phosphate acyltransferase PlsY